MVPVPVTVPLVSVSTTHCERLDGALPRPGDRLGAGTEAAVQWTLAAPEAGGRGGHERDERQARNASGAHGCGAKGLANLRGRSRKHNAPVGSRGRWHFTRPSLYRTSTLIMAI